MINSRQKGAKAEEDIKKLLILKTGLNFERTPGSGSGKIKGDLYVIGQNNKFCIEVKSYADSHFNDKVFTSKTNNFVLWWSKLLVQSKQCGQLPLLLFKYNRSKWFISTSIKPVNTDKYADFHWLNCYTLILDEWLEKERITWLVL